MTAQEFCDSLAYREMPQHGFQLVTNGQQAYWLRSTLPRDCKYSIVGSVELLPANDYTRSIANRKEAKV